MKKLLLVFSTVKYLKFRQIFYRIYYILRRRLHIPVAKPRLLNGQTLRFQQSIAYPSSFQGKSFTFLNQTYKFEEDVDWNFADYGKLWTYNLNYFEFILGKEADFDESIRLIRDYMEKRKSLKDGLEPYPVSLRGMNWIKFLISNKDKIDADLKKNMDYFLSEDFSVLAHNLEFHLLGNHLLENGFSLLFGAYYFKDKILYKKAEKILNAELKEQVLEDGAHFELSPMYHQIILFRLLDSINLVKNNKWQNDELLLLMIQTAKRMLSWLNNVTFSNGSIPMVNDAADGIAPGNEKLISYARELKIKIPELVLSDSGYRKFSIGKYECFLDVANIGPDYQPGHAHADTFNFLLNIKGRNVILDTGTSTYEENEHRQLERSTQSHNTVEVAGMNSSNVWGKFRVAERAKVEIKAENENSISASHNGYSRYGVTHLRSFAFNHDSIVIEDTVASKRKIESRAYFHFHPDEKVTLRNNILSGNGYNIEFCNNTAILLQQYEYVEGFNKKRGANCFVAEFRGNLKTTVSFL